MVGGNYDKETSAQTRISECDFSPPGAYRSNILNRTIQ